MNKLLYLIISILVILTLWSLFSPTFFQLHDFTHIARLVEMDQALKDGHFPVRWTRDFGYGYGMPLFSFYGPLPSYIAEVFHLMGFSFLTSLKLFIILMSLGGAFGMYELSKRFFGKSGGFLSAAVFIFIPYRALDLFVRGAFNELLAICLIPWILYCYVKLQDKIDRKWTTVTSLLLTALFLTHNLMTMMFVPVIYVFAMCLAFGVKRKIPYMLALHGTMILAVLASSFFLLPSYFEKGWTQVDALIGGYSYYKYHFLYIRQFFIGKWGYGGSILGLEDGVSFSFGWLVWGLTALGSIGWFLKTHGNKKLLLPPLLLLTGSALFMATFKSTPIWDNVPLIVYFQFPWRFLSVPTVIFPLLAGGAVLLLRKRSHRVTFVTIAVALFCAFNLQYFKPVDLLENAQDLYYEDTSLIQSRMSGILPDYIPISMKVKQEPFQKQFELLGSDNPIEVLVDRTHERLISFTLDEPTTLLIRIAWFPNWTVYDYQHKIAYSVDEDSGFIRVELDTGDHLITVRFEDTPLRATSNLISLIGIATIIGIGVYDRHRRS